MTKETPVARAHIDLMHIAMGQISRNMAELKAIGRITEEQRQDMTKALDSLGEVIGTALIVRLFRGKPATHDTCHGTLEVIPDDWDENIKRRENAG